MANGPLHPPTPSSWRSLGYAFVALAGVLAFGFALDELQRTETVRGMKDADLSMRFVLVMTTRFLLALMVALCGLLALVEVGELIVGLLLSGSRSKHLTEPMRETSASLVRAVQDWWSGTENRFGRSGVGKLAVSAVAAVAIVTTVRIVAKLEDQVVRVDPESTVAVSLNGPVEATLAAGATQEIRDAVQELAKQIGALSGVVTTLAENNKRLAEALNDVERVRLANALEELEGRLDEWNPGGLAPSLVRLEQASAALTQAVSTHVEGHEQSAQLVDTMTSIQQRLAFEASQEEKISCESGYQSAVLYEDASRHMFERVHDFFVGAPEDRIPPPPRCSPQVAAPGPIHSQMPAGM